MALLIATYTEAASTVLALNDSRCAKTRSHVAPPVLALDDHAGPHGVDRDHLGRVPVVPLSAVVVAGELHLVAGPELLLDLDERLGLCAAPAGGLPVVGLALVGDEPDGAALGLDRLHAVADPGTRPALLRLAERDDVAGLVAGRTLGLGAGESARFEYGRNHGILAERAIADERGADGVDQLLPALTGRVEHQRPGAVFAVQRGEVAGEDGLAGLGVGLFDDAPASGVERRECCLGVAVEHGFDGLAGLRVRLPDDFLQPERRHAVVLELAEGSAGFDGAELIDVADEDEPGTLGSGLGEQRLGVAGAEHGGLVDHPHLGRVLAAVDGAGGAEHPGDGHVLGADRVAQHGRGSCGRCERADLEPPIAGSSGVGGENGRGLGGAGAALDAGHRVGR